MLNDNMIIILNIYIYIYIYTVVFCFLPVRIGCGFVVKCVSFLF